MTWLANKYSTGMAVAVIAGELGIEVDSNGLAELGQGEPADVDGVEASGTHGDSTLLLGCFLGVLGASKASSMNTAAAFIPPQMPSSRAST